MTNPAEWKIAESYSVLRDSLPALPVRPPLIVRAMYLRSEILRMSVEERRVFLAVEGADLLRVVNRYLRQRLGREGNGGEG